MKDVLRSIIAVLLIWVLVLCLAAVLKPKRWAVGEPDKVQKVR